MSIEESYNFRRIDDQLTTSGLVSAEQLASLRTEGYESVINLLPDTYEHAVRDEERIVRDQGVDYVYIPVDFDAPTVEDFEAFATAMDERAGQKLHVHCAANWRVSAFYGLYAMRRGLWTEEQATEFISSIWNPAEYPAWTSLLNTD